MMARDIAANRDPLAVSGTSATVVALGPFAGKRRMKRPAHPGYFGK
jgi:hypothetical protein